MKIIFLFSTSWLSAAVYRIQEHVAVNLVVIKELVEGKPSNFYMAVWANNSIFKMIVDETSIKPYNSCPQNPNVPASTL